MALEGGKRGNNKKEGLGGGAEKERDKEVIG